MRVVTTAHKEGYEVYAHRLRDTWHLWPESAELYWYTEGYDVSGPRITAIENTKLQSLQMFKSRFSNYRPPSYLFDVVRFSHKVYAAIDALIDYDGIGVWLDSDCVTLQQIPEGYIESLLPAGKYIGMFMRRGMYTETGFWIMDCRHEQHRAFLSTWQDWYDSRSFVGLSNWTDCETLDATVRKFMKAGLIEAYSLSGDQDIDGHPMAHVELAKYIDHCKGPRKIAGYSPENANVAAAA